jgi:hypothetical protein
MMREFVTPSIVTPTEGLLMGGGELYLAQQKLLKFKLWHEISMVM